MSFDPKRVIAPPQNFPGLNIEVKKQVNWIKSSKSLEGSPQ